MLDVGVNQWEEVSDVFETDTFDMMWFWEVMETDDEEEEDWSYDDHSNFELSLTIWDEIWWNNL